MSTFYVPEGTVVDPSGGPVWVADLYQALLSSNIGSSIQEQLVPIMNTVLGPILPADIREVLD